MTWILVLLLVMDNDEGCSCDTLIWLLLLSKFCGLGDSGPSCGCGCGSTPTRSCGC